MVETHGPEKLRGLLRRLGEGVSIDDALEATYGFDRTGLEQQWRRSIGAPPLPQAGLRRDPVHAGRIPHHRSFRGRDAHAVPTFVPARPRQRPRRRLCPLPSQLAPAPAPAARAMPVSPAFWPWGRSWLLGGCGATEDLEFFHGDEGDASATVSIDRRQS